MTGFFDGTPLEREVTCAVCDWPMSRCACPRSAEGDAVRPQDHPLRVGSKKRRKGKTVTVVSGLDLRRSDLDGILRIMKVACAAGGTVAGNHIEIQGDHVDRVLALLKELGFPARVQAP